MHHIEVIMTYIFSSSFKQTDERCREERRSSNVFARLFLFQQPASVQEVTPRRTWVGW